MRRATRDALVEDISYRQDVAAASLADELRTLIAGAVDTIGALGLELDARARALGVGDPDKVGPMLADLERLTASLDHVLPADYGSIVLPSFTYVVYLPAAAPTDHLKVQFTRGAGGPLGIEFSRASLGYTTTRIMLPFEGPSA